METGIGQGKTLVSPLHMLLVTSAIANDGILMKPYLTDRIENYNGILVEETEPAEYGRLVSEEDAAVLQQFMEETVNDGTADRLKGRSYTAAGKTGTAEFSSSTKAAHAWFVGYAHQDGMEDIAIAVIVEDSGAGSEYAVPIARKVFDTYFSE